MPSTRVQIMKLDAELAALQLRHELHFPMVYRPDMRAELEVKIL